MAKAARKSMDGDWIQAVIQKSGKSQEAVQAFVVDHGLHESTAIPRPVDLTVRRVSFDGVKVIKGVRAPFNFDWDDMGPGLWLLGTVRNGAGKTSFIEIVRWLLRGSMPKEFPKSVRSWLENASLEFDLGGVRHCIAVHAAEPFAAKLTKTDAGKPTVVFDVTSETMFEASMGDFMMVALSLERIPTWRAGKGASPDGRPVIHGWPALFGAFHIGTNYGALLGELKFDAMQHRLLGMFAGFRHAPLVTSVFIANKEVEQVDQTGVRIQQAVAQHAQARCNALEEELEGLDAKLKDAAGVVSMLQDTKAANEELAGLHARLPELRARLSQARADAAQAKEAYDADRLALQDFVDAKAALRVFRALSPTCCPRCEQGFGADRKAKEQEELACMVCGGDAPAQETVDTGHEKRALEEQIGASKGVLDEARRVEKATDQAVSKVDGQIADLGARIERMTTRQRNSNATADLIRARELLEARLADARADAATGGKAEVSDDAAIAKACDAIARARLEDEQKETLDEVGTEMLRLLGAFGMTSVERVTLGAAGTLTVRDGGVDNTFGELSAGNKLRAKVAAVLALMIVTSKRDIGRHPGLLFVDTPGGQELRNADLEAFADGLASVAAEIPTLQVFIATTMVSQFNAAVPEGHRRVATGDDTLW